eukprot:403368032
MVLVQQSQPEASKTSLIQNFEQAGIFRPQDYSFDIAFVLNKNLDPSYGIIQVNWVNFFLSDTIQPDGSRKKEKKVIPLTFQRCGLDLFNYTDKNTIKIFGITDYYCIDNDSYQFQGGFYDENFEYIEIKVFKCQNGSSLFHNTTCKSRAELDSYWNDEKLNFAFTNTYLDYKDTKRKSKVKFFVDDSYFLELQSSVTKKTNFYIQRNQAAYQDDFIQFGQEREETFFAVSNINRYDDNYVASLGYLAAVYIRFDNRFDIYSIKNYSLFDFLGEVGGLYGSLAAMGCFVVQFFCSKMFKSDMMKKIYQIRKDPKEDDIVTQQKEKENNGQKFKRKFSIRNIYNKDQKKNIVQHKESVLQILNLNKTGVGMSPIMQNISSSQSLSEFREYQNKNIQKLESEDKLHGKNRIHNTEESENSKYRISVLNLEDPEIKPQDNFISDSVSLNPPSLLQKFSYSSPMIQQEGIVAKTKQKLIDLKDKINILSTNQKKNLVRMLSKHFNQKVKENKIGKSMQNKDNLDEEDVNELLVSFIHRTRFLYGTKKILDYIFRCFCLRKLSKLRFDEQNKAHYMFKKGKKKLEQELDVIQLLKNLRKFKLIQQAMLNQKNRMLLKFQRFNLIETSSSSSDSDDNKMETLSLMENKNPLIRLVMYGKLKKMLNQIKGKKLQPIEMNLIRGVFQRRLRDYEVNQNEAQENKILLQKVQSNLFSHPQLTKNDSIPLSQLYKERILGLVDDNEMVQESPDEHRIEGSSSSNSDENSSKNIQSVRQSRRSFGGDMDKDLISKDANKSQSQDNLIYKNNLYYSPQNLSFQQNPDQSLDYLQQQNSSSLLLKQQQFSNIHSNQTNVYQIQQQYNLNLNYGNNNGLLLETQDNLQLEEGNQSTYLRNPYQSSQHIHTQQQVSITDQLMQPRPNLQANKKSTLDLLHPHRTNQLQQNSSQHFSQTQQLNQLMSQSPKQLPPLDRNSHSHPLKSNSNKQSKAFHISLKNVSEYVDKQLKLPEIIEPTNRSSPDYSAQQNHFKFQNDPNLYYN